MTDEKLPVPVMNDSESKDGSTNVLLDAKTACRAAFVAAIKEENFYHDPCSRWSLKQHWSGPQGGFADEQLQRRWHDFRAGWMARASSTQNPS